MAACCSTICLPISKDDYLALIDSPQQFRRWLDEAKAFIESNEEWLAGLPVWLFTSGPIGEPLSPAGEPIESRELAMQLNARDRRSFGGRLEPRKLGFLERTAIHFVHAPEGDYRDWQAIRDWATTIATQLLASRAEPGAGRDESGREP